MSAMWKPKGVSPGQAKALAVRCMPSPGVSDIRNDFSQHEDSAHCLVLGGIPYDN
jgi:hypothetical protein